MFLFADIYIQYIVNYALLLQQSGCKKLRKWTVTTPIYFQFYKIFWIRVPTCTLKISCFVFQLTDLVTLNPHSISTHRIVRSIENWIRKRKREKLNRITKMLILRYVFAISLLVILVAMNVTSLDVKRINKLRESAQWQKSPSNREPPGDGCTHYGMRTCRIQKPKNNNQ